jgi:hypothetical protein
MSAVDISVDVGQRIGARLGDFGRFRGDAEDVMDDALLSFREDLQAVWPVDTGTSLQGWDTFVDGLVLVLRNAVEYASFVHVAGDDTPIVEYLDAQAQTYARQAATELRGLLARARREAGAQAPLFGARGVQRPSLASVIGSAIFRATAQAFDRRGARTRLRERFPDQPIGRATSRRRDRVR